MPSSSTGETVSCEMESLTTDHSRGDTEGKKAMSVLLHGDAAFAGESKCIKEQSNF